MKQIHEAKEKGLTPVIYITKDLARQSGTNGELSQLTLLCKKMGIRVYSEDDLPILKRIKKAKVFRYGYLPNDIEYFVKKKGGHVISGNIQLPVQ